LRSTTSLIQTAGRAARNVNGKVLMYANKITNSMKETIDTTAKRRTKQIAYNKQHEVTKHFDNNESAFNITTKVNFESNLSSEESDMLNVYDTAKFNASTNEFNTTKEVFEDGIGNISFVYKIDKNITTPHKAVKTKLNSLDLQDIGDADKKIIDQIDDNISWYYGKIITKDVETTQDKAPVDFNIIVYKEKDLGEQLIVGWYRNKEDNITSFSDDSFKPYATRAMNETTNNTISDTTESNGSVSFAIGNEESQAFIHINIPPYLWYSREGDSYAFGSGTDGTQHPYIHYRDITQEGNISSGDYKGGDIKLDNRPTRTRTGIKVYR